MSGAGAWSRAPVPAGADALVAAGFDPADAELLARRGATDPEAARRFLAPAPEHLHDPFLLAGVEAAVARLLAARDAGEKVAIVGDYDVDGVCATALLSAVLGSCGVVVETVLPHRLLEGYGFQPVHVERAAALGCGVVVTADCGSSSLAAVDAANQRGISVIITDHHLPGPELPAAAVHVNPKLEPGAYPFDGLCGAGLAFKLAAAVATRAGREAPLDALLRIACLGTIADMVPLLGENRVIATLGLAALATTRSPGLRALFHHAGVKSPITASDVGFRIGPRLNAAGRLGSADSALALLLARDLAQAAPLAKQLDEWNRERQREEQRVLEEAREMVLARSPLPPILVAWSPRWHRGVLGIAAGRLAKELLRPTLLLEVEGDTAVGSGRSIDGVELYAFLEPWRRRLLRFGGHSQAVGLSAACSELEALRGEWEAAAGAWPAELFVRRHQYELALAPEAITLERLERFEALEPHGEGNARPMLRVGPLRLAGSPSSFGRDHLSARATGPSGWPVRLLGWGWQPRRKELSGSFDVLAYLERDHYRGEPTLRLVDCRPASET